MNLKFWTLVMNAGSARILRGFGTSDNPAPAELVMRVKSEKLRDIMADKPGRSMSSSRDGRRSGMEYGSDPLKEDERQFVREVISVLEAHLRTGDLLKLAVFAGPRTLGIFREELTDVLSAAVMFESDKNLVALTPAELTAAVTKDLESAPGVRRGV